MKRILNTLILIFIAVVVVVLLTKWLRPTPIRVDVAKATRGPMRVTVDGEGKTRVRDRYTVATPVSGRLRRIALRRGDAVEQGQLLAVIEPLPLAPLDPRQRAEAVGRVNAAEDAKFEADRLVERNWSIYEQAKRDLERCESLARSGVISRQEVERAQTLLATSLREYQAAKSKAESAAHGVEVARAALIAIDSTGRRSSGATVKVQAPTRGKVLRVLEESERVVVGGTPLVEVSNPSNLEIVIELLSTDAVKVSSGALVLIEDWGGPGTLEAHVRLIEPSAFTKVSALGIEEQRVNVVADLAESVVSVGDGYRVEGRIVTWEGDNVLRVPVSALFRRGEHWSLFVAENGRATLRDVEVDHRTPFEAEIKRGLEEGAEVIIHPSNQISDGARVETIRTQN
ncbi:MAG TPA: HlyD family efflux transporter periplasmic adaptor subunit [Pyrinomonadaceae bacterium]|nr:HlyD family efflux transporter periplasmic adaptor subunit [Pyrinomonadaceae bacterium]